jgi:VWFA-related protein
MTVSLLLLCEFTSAQSFAPEYTLHVDVSEVRVEFTVSDLDNRPIHELSSSDLQLLVDGSPVNNTKFRGESNLPIRLVLLVDSSSSVRGIFAYEKEKALEFLKEIIRPDSDQVMIQRFDNVVHVVQPFTTDPVLAVAALSKLPASYGVTSLYDAVYTASEQLMAQGDNRLARRAIILFSDGEDNNSFHSLEDAIEMAQLANLVVYAINVQALFHQKHVRHSDHSERRGDVTMKRIAESTGGVEYEAGTDLHAAFQEIEHALRSVYSLAFYARFASGEGFHSVRIETTKNLKVRCRSGYWVTANRRDWTEP